MFACIIIITIFALTNFADMVKLVDMPDLGSGAARRVGSSPIIRTFINYKTLKNNLLRVFYFKPVLS
jgi:hypothetical protein